MISWAVRQVHAVSMESGELSTPAKDLRPVSEGLEKGHKDNTRPLFFLFLWFLPKTNSYIYFILMQIFDNYIILPSL